MSVPLWLPAVATWLAAVHPLPAPPALQTTSEPGPPSTTSIADPALEPPDTWLAALEQRSAPADPADPTSNSVAESVATESVATESVATESGAKLGGELEAAAVDAIWHAAWSLAEWLDAREQPLEPQWAARAGQALVPWTRAADGELRWVAVRALGRLEPAAAGLVSALAAASEDPDPDVRWAAVEALGRTTGEGRADAQRALAAVLERVHAEPPALGSAACRALARLEVALDDRLAEGLAVLARGPAERVPPELRHAAAAALALGIREGSRKDADAVYAPFVADLSHAAPQRRIAAAMALAGARAERGFDALLDTARGGDQELAATATSALVARVARALEALDPRAERSAEHELEQALDVQRLLASRPASPRMRADLQRLVDAARTADQRLRAHVDPAPLERAEPSSQSRSPERVVDDERVPEDLAREQQTGAEAESEPAPEPANASETTPEHTSQLDDPSRLDDAADEASRGDDPIAVLSADATASAPPPLETVSEPGRASVWLPALVALLGLVVLPQIFGLGAWILRPAAVVGRAQRARRRLGRFAPLLGLELWAGTTRALDAWTAAHAPRAREELARHPVVAAKRLHVALPVVVTRGADSRRLPELTVTELRALFTRERGAHLPHVPHVPHVMVVGDDGCGKSTLLARIARLALAAHPSERPFRACTLPILLCDEQALERCEAPADLIELLRVELARSTAAELDRGLAAQLAASGRVVVLIDGLGRWSNAARARVAAIARSSPHLPLVVSTRPGDGLVGWSGSEVHLAALAGPELAAFVERYLSQRLGRSLLDDAELFEGCARLARLAHGRSVPAASASRWAEDWIAQQDRSARTAGDAPERNAVSGSEALWSSASEVVEQLADRDRDVRRAATEQCLRWGRAVVPTLLRRLDASERRADALGAGADADPRLAARAAREAVIAVLERMGPEAAEAAPALAERVAAERDTRAALAALAAIGPQPDAESSAGLHLARAWSRTPASATGRRIELLRVIGVFARGRGAGAHACAAVLVAALAERELAALAAAALAELDPELAPAHCVETLSERLAEGLDQACTEGRAALACAAFAQALGALSAAAAPSANGRDEPLARAARSSNALVADAARRALARRAAPRR